MEAIWLKRNKGGPMDSQTSVRLISGQGLENDANLGGKRQITILSADSWDQVIAELGEQLDPSLRRANLLVSGIDLAHSRDRVLRIGPSRIHIYGETRPCEVMDQAFPGLRQALEPDWRGGAYGEVLEGGTIRVSDPIGWES